jgi:hypothetical protein
MPHKRLRNFRHRGRRSAPWELSAAEQAPEHWLMRREAPEPYPDRETDEAKDQDAIRHPATESDEGCRHGGQTGALEACCAKTSHNFIQIQANRSGKSGLRSVEKFWG